MRIAIFAGLGLASTLLSAPAQPIDYCDTEPRVVTPGKAVPGGLTAPSDAIVLFDGRGLSQWKSKSGGPAPWEVKDGVLTVKKGSGDITTQQAFHDVQLHLEWRIPEGISGEGQHRGNSGVFLMDRYEVQILDSYHNRTYADGAAGAIYGQVSPLVNAMRPPGEWNSYDIIFTAPRFYDDGTLLSAARMTVLHNGVLIQNNAEVLGGTGAWGRPGYHDASTTGSIRLQDHPGPDPPVSFRNIWVRELNAGPPVGVKGTALKIVSSKTIDELLRDPASRSVLVRCVPELVPNPKILDYVGNKTLPQLLGELDIALSEGKLQQIEAELTEVQSKEGLREEGRPQ